MSFVGTLANKICDILNAKTNVKMAVIGTKDAGSQNFPIAQVALDAGEIDMNNLQATFDIDMKLYVMVDGASFEQVEDVLEDALTVFLEGAEFQSLVTLGVVQISPSRLLPPLNFDNNADRWRGAAHFDLRYRLTFV